MSSGNIPFFELDVSVPSQLYMIEYSLVEKGSFPFVPDFLLKLLHISDFQPQEVALFFGFSRKELDFALKGFFVSGEVEYRKDGKIGLTSKGHALFSDADSSPMRKSVECYRKPFCFDLLIFSYLGNKPMHGQYARTLRLNVDREKLAESQILAKDSFQKNIHEIYRRGHLAKGAPLGSVPEMYKLIDCSKRRDFNFKVSEVFSLNSESYQFAFDDQEGLSESDAYIRARTEALSSASGASNLSQISKVADMLEDEFTLSLLKNEGLDAQRLTSLAIDELQGHESGSERQRLYGSLQLKRNWDVIVDELKSMFKSTSKDKPVLTWVSPSCHELWGKSERHGQVLSELYELFSNSEFGKDSFKVYVPLPDDKSRHARNLARNENQEAKGRLFGFVESGRVSSVELMLLKGSFAVVLYHYTDTEKYQAPVPFGFLSKRKSDICAVEELLMGVLNEYTSAGFPRDLGSLNG